LAILISDLAQHVKDRCGPPLRYVSSLAYGVLDLLDPTSRRLREKVLEGNDEQPAGPNLSENLVTVTSAAVSLNYWRS